MRNGTTAAGADAAAALVIRSLQRDLDRVMERIRDDAGRFFNVEGSRLREEIERFYPPDMEETGETEDTQ